MSFLKDYEIFTQNNECPKEFHTWSAISVLSSITSRKICLDLGLFKYYPSLYILLVGSAGVSKSTALSVAKSIVKEIEQIYRSPSSITKEMLTKTMGLDDSPCELSYLDSSGKSHSHRHVSIFCNELVTLLNAGGNASGIIDFLTDIWNEEDEFRVETKNSGCDYIPKPFITMLGCMTTDKLNSMLSQKIFSSGFNRRCLFVYSDKRAQPVAFPSVSDEQKEAWNRCVLRAKEIFALTGTFEFTDEAREFWKYWYDEINDKEKGYETSRFRRDYLETRPEFILKLAMLLTVSDSNTLVLTKEILEKAISMILKIEPRMHIAFESSGRNTLSPISVEIRDFINRSKEPVPYQKLVSSFWNQADPSEIKLMIEHLIKTEQIQETTMIISGKVLKLLSKMDYDLDTYQLKQQLENK